MQQTWKQRQRAKPPEKPVELSVPATNLSSELLTETDELLARLDETLGD